MALTIAFKTDDLDYWGKHIRIVAELTGDTSYPAGGYPIVGGDLNVGSIRDARVLSGNAVANALLGCWDFVNKKFMVLYPTGAAAASPAALADPAQGAPTVDTHAAAQTVTARLSGANTITTWLDATALSDTPALAHVV